MKKYPYLAYNIDGTVVMFVSTNSCVRCSALLIGSIYTDDESEYVPFESGDSILLTQGDVSITTTFKATGN